MWRVVPVVNSALLVLLSTIFALTLLESARAEAEANLGLTSEGLRVVVMRPGDLGGDELSAALVALAAEEALSIAYTASELTGFVTVLDMFGRLGNGQGSLGDILPPPGTGPSAVVSDGLADPSSLEPVLARQAEVVGSFPASDVTFEGRRPFVVYNVDAVPFDEGYYLIAGDGILSGGLGDRIVDVFDDHGMAIVEVSPIEAGGPGRTLAGLLTSLYGIILLLFSGIVVINHLVVLSIDAALARQRWLVLATLGADRGGVRAAVGAHLGRRVLLGGVVGAILATLLALVVQGLAQAPTSSRLATVPASLTLVWGISAVICWLVAWREGRWVTRAVPS